MNRNFLIGQRLIAICVLGALALNYPLLALFNRSQTIFGIPILSVYLFVIWSCIIVLCAWIVERH